MSTMFFLLRVAVLCAAGFVVCGRGLLFAAAGCYCVLWCHRSDQRQGVVDRCVGRYSGDGAYVNLVNPKLDFGFTRR
jgi:hypothetical protein